MNLFRANYSFLLQRGSSCFRFGGLCFGPSGDFQILKNSVWYLLSRSELHVWKFPPQRFFWDEIFEVNGNVFEFVRVLERLSCPGELPTGRR